MKKKSLMILGIYLIVCFIGVSFAWMQATDGQGGNAIVFSYDPNNPNEESRRTLSVKSRGVDAEVYVFDETINDYVVTTNLSEGYLGTGLIPNKTLNFKIVFTNSDEEEQAVDLELAGVQSSSDELLENMYFSLTRTTGYSQYSSYIPKTTYIRFEDNKKGSGPYTISLIKELYIPPTITVDNETQEQTNNPIEIYGYFLLSRLADESFENLSLDIGYFRVIL